MIHNFGSIEKDDLCFQSQEHIQERSEGTSSVALEVVIKLSSNINVKISSCLTSNFCLLKIMPFANRRERLFLHLWTRLLSFGF